MAESMPFTVIPDGPGWAVLWKDGTRADDTFVTREQALAHARSIAGERSGPTTPDARADERDRDDDGLDFDRDMDVLFARDAELYRRLAQ